MLSYRTEENTSEIVNDLITQTGSLQQLHQLLSLVDNEPGALKEAFKLINTGNLPGDADDYHNISVCYARQGDYTSACEILEKSIPIFPYNSDLLADYIKYGSKAGELEKCAQYYKKLREIPVNAWTWRGFDFSIDYKIELYAGADDGSSEQEEIIKELEFLSKEFQRCYPYNEQAYLAEYAYLNAVGLKEQAINRLRETIDKYPVMPKCCLQYCDLMLERGEYEKVIEYAEKGIMGDAQNQSTIKTGYLFFISGLAKDALIWRDKKFNDENSIRDMYLDYRIAEKLNDNTTVAIQRQINLRTTIMGFKSGFLYDDDTKANDNQDFESKLNKEKDIDL